MQRPIHHARHAQPAAPEAVPGMVPSCAAERRAPFGDAPVSGWDGSAGWWNCGLGAPASKGIRGAWSGRARLDGQKRYDRQRGRTVARP